MIDAQIKEIEVGPHFLTVYSKKLTELLELAEKLYLMFLRFKPELADIQQVNFKHEPNDPNVYHPYGEPNHFRDHFRHFHIRYGYRPKVKEIAEVLDLLDNLTDTSQIVITALETNRLPEYTNWKYPEPPQDHIEYLKWIEEIRGLGRIGK